MKAILINSFTGLSDFDNKGLEGSFKFGQNLDVRKEMDSLSAGQALTDDLAVGTMTGLALFVVNCSDGNSYHFCRNGKIYKRTSARSYSLVYTDSEGVITGACEWVNNKGNKFLYWSTLTKLHRKAIPGNTSWTDVDATVNGQTYPKTNLTSATWHTMMEMGAGLYICNANTLAFVGYDDSYTNNALELVPGNNAKCLMEYNNYAYIGCSRDDNSQRGYLFAWDMGQSLNWNAKRKQGGSPVNALIDAEYPLAQVGTNGKVRFADVTSYSLPIKSFPGGGSVNPQGVEADDLAYFGSFGNTKDESETTRTGIYTFGRLLNNANPVMNLEYLLDADEIGYVQKVGSDLLISYYKSGTGYGIKRVDSGNKATGLYRSIDLKAPISNRETLWTQVRLVMKALPSGSSISVKRRINKTGDWLSCKLASSMSATFDTINGTEAIFLIGDKGKICEIEITLNPVGNDSPEIYQVEVYFE